MTRREPKFGYARENRPKPRKSPLTLSLILLAFASGAVAEPSSLQLAPAQDRYLELRTPAETAATLELSADLRIWKPFTVLAESAPAARLLVHHGGQSRFARLKLDDPNIHEIIPVSSNPLPKSERLLGWDFLNETPDSDFGANYMLVSEIGADFSSIHFSWSDLEPGVGTIDEPFADPLGRLAAVEAFLIAVQENTGRPLKVALTLRPIDATGKTVPSDLQDQSFGSETDTRMADRFVRLLKEQVFQFISPASLTSLQIGNEIDLYDASREPETFWSDYGWFLHHVKQQLASDPETGNLKLGFTVSFHGIASAPAARRAPFLDFASAVDIVGVTYYGNVHSGWEVEKHTVQTLQTDFESFAALFPNRPIYLQELGFQSSPLNDSSEIEQARFYRSFFEAWDSLQSRVPLVNIVRLNDHSPDLAKAEAEPYDIDPIQEDYQNFVEYLRTLGVRTYGEVGRLKPAFEILKAEANRRGWGTAE